MHMSSKWVSTKASARILNQSNHFPQQGHRSGALEVMPNAAIYCIEIAVATSLNFSCSQLQLNQNKV